MESVAVFAAGVAIIWLVFWQIRHDRVRSISEQRGPFRMRTDTTAGGAARPKGIGSVTGLRRPESKEPR